MRRRRRRPAADPAPPRSRTRLPHRHPDRDGTPRPDRTGRRRPEDGGGDPRRPEGSSPASRPGRPLTALPPITAAAGSLTGRAASSLHGCPGPSTPTANARAIRAPLRPPGKRHALPNHQPSRQRTRPHHPGGKPPGRRADKRGMNARLSGARQAEPATGTARPWPSVESRRCTPTVLAAERRPPCVRGHRDTGTYSDTR